MAQINSSTSEVTSTDGIVHTNDPINVDNTLRATSTSTTIGSCDLNEYPAIQIDTVTSSLQYWIYAIGDEATRDADLALF